MKIKKIMFYICFMAGFICIEDFAIKYSYSLAELLSIILNLFQVILLIGICKKNGFKIKDYIGKVNIGNCLVAMFLGFFLMIMCSPIEYSDIFPKLSKKSSDINESNGMYSMITCIYACFIAPITEEVVFRALLFKELKSRYSLVKAVFLSSFMFMILHTGSVSTGAFTLAIASSLYFYFTENIIYSILMHFSGNSILLIAYIFSSVQSSTQHDYAGAESEMILDTIDLTIFSFPLFMLSFFIVAIVVSCVMFIVYTINKNNEKKIFSTEKCENDIIVESSITEFEKEGYRKYFIIYFLLCLIGNLSVIDIL